MFTISKDQIASLAAATDAAFATQVMAWARTHLEPWTSHLSDARLRARVNHGIARAREHGFTWQSSIATFVALMLRFAPDFDTYPPIRAILEEAGADPEARADRLFTEVSPEQWEAVEDAYDPAVWDEDFEITRP